MPDDPRTSFDAFLSYSHALDGVLAPTVQRELERFAKPWYRPRVLRVFRDDAVMGANPDLWATIERAIRSSRWFILMASPEAARSTWVAQEVDLWMRERSAANFLVALTDGTLAFDERREIDWSRTDALPEVLRGRLHGEPRWVDLRQLNTVERVNRGDPRFREGIADLAAPLRDLDKDRLIGEHIRQHHRTMRTAWLGTATLVVLVVVALVAAGLAYQQTRTAQSRQAAVNADALFSQDPDLAALLAVQAHRTRPTVEAATSLYEADSFALQQKFVGHPGEVSSAAFSSDGRTFTTTSTEDSASVVSTAWSWDVGSGRLRRRFDPPTDRLNASVTVSPDGAIAATTSAYDPVQLWDIGSDRRTPPLADTTDAEVTFSPDATMIATVTDGRPVQLWDAATGRPGQKLNVPHDEAAVTFSPDGKTVSTAELAGAGRLWDVATGRLLHTLAGPPVGTMSVVFSPDSTRVATTGSENDVRLWDVGSGGLVRTFPADSDPVAFSPDGKTLATSGSEDGMRLWDADSGDLVHTFPVGDDPVAFSPDSTMIATGSREGPVQLWDVATGRLIQTLNGHSDRIQSVVFSPDGETVATTSSDATARLWDVGPMRPRTAPTDEDSTLESVGFAPDGTLTATNADGVTQAWDAESLQPVGTHHPRLGALGTSLALSPDGRMAATAAIDGIVRLWDARTRQRTRTLPAHPTKVELVLFSPDSSTVVTASADGTAWLWDAASGELRQKLPGHTDRIYSVVFSPDQQTIATTSFDKTARVWDAETGELEHVLPGHTGAVVPVTFSPDGTTLATGSSDGTARVWDVETGQPYQPLLGHTGPVGSVTFSPDGTTLATGSSDGTARVWDVESGQQRRMFTGHAKSVSSVAFSPDGTTLATGGGDGSVQLWDAALPDVEQIKQRICHALNGRDLTPQERSAYLEGLPDSPVCPAP